MINKILISVILILVYSSFLNFDPKVATDFPLASQDQLQQGFNRPMAWSDRSNGDFGSYNVSTLWSWPVDLVFGVGSELGLDFALLERLVGILPIILVGSFGIYQLLSFYRIEGWGRVVGIIFFLCNPYILQVIDGGQLLIGIAYAWIPLAFLSWRIAILNKRFKQKLLAALSVIMLGFLDPRYIYLLFILILLQIFYDIISKKANPKSLFLQYFWVFVLTAILGFSFNLYWILPSIYLRAPQLPLSYYQVSQVNFLSFATLGHGLFLQPPHWPENVFGRIALLNAEFVLIPLMVFLAPIFRRRDLNIGYWLLVSLVAIFLIKGANPPFGEVYTWMFANIPAFYLFRDPTKFFSLICLSYAILISMLVDKLQKFNFLPLLVILYLIFLIRPIFLDQTTGLLSEPRFKAEYLNLKDFISQRAQPSKVLWVPQRSGLGYSDGAHPAVDATVLVQKRPFAIGTRGRYEYLNFLREAPFAGELLDISGVGYLVFPPLDPKRSDLSTDDYKYYDLFFKQISNLPWVENKIDKLQIPVLKTRTHQESVFITPNNWLIVGSDNIYNESTKSASTKLSRNSLIFAEQFPGIASRVIDNPNVKIDLNNKTKIDLAASLIDSSAFIFPAMKLQSSPDRSGWWKRDSWELIFWRDFLQQKYQIDNQDLDFSGGWAVSEGEKELVIKNNLVRSGKLLLARVMESSRSGEMNFYQDNNLVGQVKTQLQKNSTNFRWHVVGQLHKDSSIVIKTKGDINVVNSLAIIDQKLWNFNLEKVKKLEEQNRFSQFSNQQMIDEVPEFSFEKINAVKYKVKIKGIKRAVSVVLSQNYDPLWGIESYGSAIPVYGFLNGFIIDKDGEYLIEYKAQKFVDTGLLIIGVSSGLLILLIILTSRKNLTTKIYFKHRE